MLDVEVEVEVEVGQFRTDEQSQSARPKFNGDADVNA